MLKLVAFVLLALTASPLTAPFRACDPSWAADTALTEDLGSVVAPRTTHWGRSTVAAPAQPLVSYVHALRRVDFIGALSAAVRGVMDRSVFSTVLRL
jgi:hypothetical protein